tara:strand:+ start:3374 stop:6124 length:2751 start_codon:yes stop_codon:yes gene_type:complete
MRMPHGVLFRLLSVLCLTLAIQCGHTAEESPILHCYISTGDNQWLGQSLPIDSPASIDASIDLLHRLGVKRLYWRGLEAAAWMDQFREREHNVRYWSFWKWFRHLYRTVDPDRVAVESAHKRGIEIWGVGNIFDWGAQAEVPPFKFYPYGGESSLRVDNPDWVPVDKSGLLKQGGPIELAYPEARKALVDLHVKYMKRDGYDGMTFLTYSENHSMRFQDEFGFSEPIVEEFKRRHRIDIRYQAWTRFATREDWRALRGEYVTAFLSELNAALPAKQRNVGFFLQPWNPHDPQPWNVPEVIQTAGSMKFDLEGWVRDGLVNDFLVYGYSDRRTQVRAVRNMRWMTRDTPVNVGILTSGPYTADWKRFQKEGVPTVIAFGEDAMYLDRSNLPQQPMSSLQSDDPLLVMKALSQVVYGKSKAGFEDVAPLMKHPHLIVRRLAVQSLGKIGGQDAIAAIEAALFDSENSIRCMAGVALRDAHGPNSVKAILRSIELHGNHMLAEIMRTTLPRIRPLPREELARAYRESKSVEVRQMAMRALTFMPDHSLVPTWVEAINDTDRFTRVAAVRGLAGVAHHDAMKLLLATIDHEDPVMANEACHALGSAIERNVRGTENLRESILLAIRNRYSKFGDSYEGTDADWAYRPVGNALLAFGEEGQSVLQSFVDQSTDRELAVKAWKSLYIRQRPNTFSEVAEKENEEAMRQRPIFLKKPVAPRLKQDFDDTAKWSPEGRGMVGDVNQVSGRWGALLDEGPHITREDALNGGQSLLIRRGGHSFTGHAMPEIDDRADYQLTLQLFRKNEHSTIVIQLRGPNGGGKQELALFVGEDEILRLRDEIGEKWISSGLTIKPREWTKITVTANRRTRRYTVAIREGDGDEQISRIDAPLNVQEKVRLMTLFPQPPEGSVTLVDDIALMEVR